jgi:hypothetical protein
MLRQLGVFSANEQVMELVMDSNALKRGTTMAKRTSIHWGNTSANDTELMLRTNFYTGRLWNSEVVLHFSSSFGAESGSVGARLCRKRT